MREYDLIIIGAGASGILCAIEGSKKGIENILLIEKDPILGGALSAGDYNISKNNKITGKEFKENLFKEFDKYSNIDTLLGTMALKIEDNNEVVITSTKGIEKIKGKKIILCNGAKEGSRKAVGMVGDRCSGIYTVGMAKKIFNMDNMIPGKNILVYGNETLYMLENDLKNHNVNIVGIVTFGENKETFGVSDTIYDGYEITSIKGEGRVEEVVLNKGSEQLKVNCDTIIFARPMLSDGLVAMRSGINLNSVTTGPVVDKSFMTSRENIFACGNGIYIHESIEDIESECVRVIENIIKK
ncbi:FAD-dependent oxidoreductase [Romboutsia sp.]|uniref:FAD-dependent oxidoreductase n=1 Tax=Romboutsia sp. TaxID=1965302 RepID=UPI003F36C848